MYMKAQDGSGNDALGLRGGDEESSTRFARLHNPGSRGVFGACASDLTFDRKRVVLGRLPGCT